MSRPVLVRSLIVVVDGAWLTLDRSAEGREADDAIACDAQIVAEEAAERGEPGLYEITSYQSLGEHDEGPLHTVRRVGDLPRLGAA